MTSNNFESYAARVVRIAAERAGARTGTRTEARTETRGRKPGSVNTPAHVEAQRVGMIAAHAVKSSRPGYCDECGREACGRDAIDLFRGRWLCNSCLTDEMEPLRIEDFAWSGTSNLGAAIDDEGMVKDHCHGPTGDAPAKPRRHYVQSGGENARRTA